jgi:ABC-type phosphate transport system ATPase subunit
VCPPARPATQVGPEGCGKATALRHCFARLRRRGGVAVAEVHCSAATGAAQVIDKLVQVRVTRRGVLTRGDITVAP